MVLPSKLGELSYSYLLKKSRMNVTEGLASVIISRVYDFVIILVVLLFVSIGFQAFFRLHPSLVILLVTLLIGFLVLGLFCVSTFLR
jgi:hypothetical protein